VIGRRCPDTESLRWVDHLAGDYWKHILPGGGLEWWIVDPLRNLGRLTLHSVTEHPDGTITVTPSILVTGTRRFHGWLKAGVWSFADDSERPVEAV
jgi:hypothetical protein